ncbi:hypothetical protein [Desulfoluna sp.]|uniref:DUF6933 domain-containing protein n=1 Tax=Desulfoluna sp. TaxID=2045199 RepID=UPI002623B19F|nr:hypothetical protein [Desulfoluna sp.]
MLVFNCTKAFAAFIADAQGAPVETPSIRMIADDPSFCDGTAMHWVVHLVKIARRNCVIAMHVRSRYAIVMVGVRKGDFSGFVNAFCHRLVNEMVFLCAEEGLVGEEYASLVAENFVDKHQVILACVRGDRSVQAHINDVSLALESEAGDMGGLPVGPDEAFDFGRHVNALLRTTRESRDSFYPFEVMCEHWFEDVCVEIVDPEVLDRLSEEKTVPDNVIVLADYRK